jgi:hypothetical protein
MTEYKADKLDVIHVENTAVPNNTARDDHKEVSAKQFVTDNTDYHSPFNELSFWKTIKLFRVAAFCCFAGSFGALSDNYQLSVPGNVLALPGFIRTMGIPDPTAPGGYTIPTVRISAWSGRFLNLSTS